MLLVCEIGWTKKHISPALQIIAIYDQGETATTRLFISSSNDDMKPWFNYKQLFLSSNRQEIRDPFSLISYDHMKFSLFVEFVLGYNAYIQTLLNAASHLEKDNWLYILAHTFSASLWTLLLVCMSLSSYGRSMYIRATKAPRRPVSCTTRY